MDTEVKGVQDYWELVAHRFPQINTNYKSVQDYWELGKCLNQDFQDLRITGMNCHLLIYCLLITQPGRAGTKKGRKETLIFLIGGLKKDISEPSICKEKHLTD